MEREYKNIMEDANKGKFEKVVDILEIKKIKLSSNDALKIIIGCCKACSENMAISETSMDYSALYKLLCCCVKYLGNNLSETQVNNYLQSLFFITTFLIKKKSMEIISRFEEILIAECLPLTLTLNQMKTYENICKILSNEIVRISNAKQKDYNNYLVQIIYMIAVMYKSRINNKLDTLLQNAFNNLLCLKNLKLDKSNLMNVYIRIIKLLELNEQIDNKIRDEHQVFRGLINLFTLIYTTCLEEASDCDFEYATRTLNETVLVIKKIFKDENKEMMSISISSIQLLIDLLVVSDCFLKTKNSFSQVDNVIKTARSSLRTYFKKNGLTESLYAICNCISTTNNSIALYYKNVDKKIWIERTNLHLEYYKFLFDVFKLTIRNNNNKLIINGKKLNKEAEAIKILYVIACLAKIAIYEQKEFKTLNYCYNDLLKYFQEYYNCCVWMKENKYEKWIFYWRDLAITQYNIGIFFFKKNSLIGLNFLEKLLLNLLKFEGVDNSIVSERFLTNCLGAISDLLINLDKLQESLYTIALNMTICIKQKNADMETIINRWIKAKSKLSLSQEPPPIIIMSVISAFKKNQYYQFELSNNEKIKLLQLELEAYKNLWPSKLSMMIVYKELYEIEESSFELVKIFTNIWGKSDLMVHERIPFLLKDTLERFIHSETININNNNNNIETNIYLAHLYFLLHKYSLNDVIRKNIQDIDKTIIQIENKNIDFDGGIPIDPKDQCDIVSTYGECLQFHEYIKIVKSLNKANSTLDNILKVEGNGNFSIDSLKTIQPETLYDLLKLIANEYRLHSNLDECLKFWRFALNIGKLFKNDLFILEASGYLMELSTEDHHYQNIIVKSALSKDADKIAEKLIQDNMKIINKEEALISYYICKGMAFCYNNEEDNIFIAKDSLRIAKTILTQTHINDNIEDNSIPIIFLKGRLYVLEHMLIMLLPCKYNFDVHHMNFSTTKIHLAYKIFVDNYIEDGGYSNNKSSYQMSILFETTELLVKWYHCLRMPREVRCYAREILLIAQKLLLPIHSAKLLHYLAYADIAYSSINDCKVKVDGITNILGLNRNNSSPLSTNPLLNNSRPSAVDDEEEEKEEVLLDLPKTNYKQYSDGSPALPLSTFKLPTFLKHPYNCECFYCKSIVYQSTYLNKTLLEALLNQYEKNYNIAMDFFKGGLKLFELFKIKQNSETNNNLFIEEHSTILFEYINFLLRLNHLDGADEINRKLINELKSTNDSKYYYLYNECLVQRINILTLRMMKEKQFKKHHQNNKLQQVPVAAAAAVTVATDEAPSKTPENKQTQIQIKYDFHFNEELPSYSNQHRIKPLKLNLSDNDDDEQNKSRLLQTSSSIPKIKIYTSSSKSKKTIVSVTHNQQSKDEQEILLLSANKSQAEHHNEADGGAIRKSSRRHLK